MKILHIIPSYKPAFIYGGPIISVSSLAEEQVKLGHNVTVYTTTANGDRELEVEPGKEIDVGGVKVTYFKRITGDHTHISPALWRHLYNTVESYDAVHVHSWWNFLVIGAVYICRKKSVIPVISPRGMLSEYVMTSRNAFKKRLIHLFIGKYLLRT